MTIDLTNNTWLTLVADAGTPQPLVQYAGVRILLQPADLAKFPATGVIDSLKVLGATVPGFWRTAADGSGYEWVMTAANDPVTTALNAVPGTDTWRVPASRTTFGTVGGKMLAQGFSLAEAQSALTSVYQAAAANYAAAHP